MYKLVWYEQSESDIFKREGTLFETLRYLSGAFHDCMNVEEVSQLFNDGHVILSDGKYTYDLTIIEEEE